MRVVINHLTTSQANKEKEKDSMRNITQSRKSLDKIKTTISDRTNEKGSGNHAVCYSHPTDRHKVLLATNCKVREELGKKSFLKSSYFPEINKLSKVDGVQIYQMEKYLHINAYTKKKLNKKDIKIYEELKLVSCVTDIRESRYIPKTLKVVIIHAFNRLKSLYGDSRLVCFDICQQNMMVTRKGQLILNDIFWVDKKLNT